MPDFSPATSFWLVARTYPFVLLRIAIYFGISAAIVVAAGAGAGIGQAIGSLAGQTGRVPGAFWGSLAGIASITAIVWWLREYLLYLIKAGHVAAMVLLLEGKPLAAGPGQVAQAADLVQRRFRDMSMLMQIERLVNGALADVLAFAPLPASLGPEMQRPASVHRALHFALGFLREIVLAAPLRNASRSVWTEMRDAIVVFAQSLVGLMRNALLLAAIAYGICFLVFLMCLIPAASLAAGSSGSSFLVAMLLAAAFAWSFKQALMDPFLIASMLQVFSPAKAGPQPDPFWDVKLTEASEAFREIKARSIQIARGAGQL